MMRMIVFFAAGAIACLLVAITWIAARRRLHVMANPHLWPRTLSRSQLTRYGNYYLRAAGWDLLPLWEYEDVRMRASKPGIELNIFVVDDAFSTLGLATRDVAEKSRRKQAIVGLLTQQVIHAELRREAESSGIFVVGPSDLPQIEKAIRRAGARHQQWRQAATAA